MKETPVPVKLRALEPEDLDFLYSLENDPEYWDVGNNNVPYSHFSLSSYIMGSTSDIYGDKQMRLVIENENREAVGLLDLFNFDPKHRRAEVGIAVVRKARGMGLGHAALLKIIIYARIVLHLRQLYAFANADNTRSVQLFCGAGFHQEALLEQWFYDGKDYHDAVIMQLLL